VLPSTPQLLARAARYVAAGGAAPSNPSALFGSNLLAWYDAHTGVTGTSPVTAWADQSGNSANLSGSVGPTYNATGFNGRPTLTFSAPGLTRLDTAQGAVNWPVAVAVGSFFFVGQMTASTSSFGRAMAFCGSATSTDFSSGGSSAVFTRDSTNNNIEGFTGSAAVGQTAISASTNLRFGIVYDGVNGTTYINNVLGAATGSAANWGTSGTLRIGGDLAVTSGTLSTPSNMWDGPISEVVVLKQTMSSTDRSNLDAWFKFNWGL